MLITRLRFDQRYRIAYLVALPLSWVVVPLWLKFTGSIHVASSLLFLKCPLNMIFGITCPTCGLTRSVLAAWSGNFSAANFYHPFGLPLWILSLGIWLLVASEIFGMSNAALIVQSAKSFWFRARASIWFRSLLFFAIGFYAYWGFFLREPIN